jgi:hypothetical protein
VGGEVSSGASVGVNSVGAEAECVGEPVTGCEAGLGLLVAGGGEDEGLRQCVYCSSTAGSGDPAGFIWTALL